MERMIASIAVGFLIVTTAVVGTVWLLQRDSKEVGEEKAIARSMDALRVEIESLRAQLASNEGSASRTAGERVPPGFEVVDSGDVEVFGQLVEQIGRLNEKLDVVKAAIPLSPDGRVTRLDLTREPGDGGQSVQTS